MNLQIFQDFAPLGLLFFYKPALKDGLFIEFCKI
jgi:hypothetical protein